MRPEFRIDLNKTAKTVAKQIKEYAPDIAKKYNKSQKEKVKKFNQIGPLFGEVLLDHPGKFEKLEKELKERSKRPSDRDPNRGLAPRTRDFDENETVLGIAQMAGLKPDSIESNSKNEHLEKLKTRMTQIEFQLQTGELTPQKLNDRIDAVTQDPYRNFLNNVLKDLPRRTRIEIERKLENILGEDGVDLVKKSENLKKSVENWATGKKKKKRRGFWSWFFRGLVGKFD